MLKSEWLECLDSWGLYQKWRRVHFVLYTDRLSWHRTTELADSPQGSLKLSAECTVAIVEEKQLVLTSPTPTLLMWCIPQQGAQRLVLRCASSQQARAWQRALVMTISQLEAEHQPPGAAAVCAPCEKVDCCAICLQDPSEQEPSAVDVVSRTAREEEPFKLLKLRRCNHELCLPCLKAHTSRQQRLSTPVWCPVCRRSLDVQDVLDASSEGVKACMKPGGQGTDEMAAVDAEAPLPRCAADGRKRERANREENRKFEAAARKLHMKKCPGCSAPIIKNGGCNNMNCRVCRTAFKWDKASPLFPCNSVHINKKGMPFWCYICPGASPIAKAKLFAVRAVVLSVSLPAVAIVVVGAGGCLTVYHISMILHDLGKLAFFGPLAACYQPFHNYLEKTRIAKETREDELLLQEWKRGQACVRWQFLRLMFKMKSLEGDKMRDEAFSFTWYACNTKDQGYFYFSVAEHNQFKITRIDSVQWERPRDASVSIIWVEENGNPLSIRGIKRNDVGPLKRSGLAVPPPPSSPNLSKYVRTCPRPRSRTHRPNPVLVRMTKGLKSENSRLAFRSLGKFLKKTIRGR
ncbi:hypothetical protein AB1Y20_001547 [Prymnesium parvum]|uniref:RING-type domain-containing protein n=1 Tax=Prymnesium parvum TaxID=97485 RepID=A0AB34KB66_PRYPA